MELFEIFKIAVTIFLLIVSLFTLYFATTEMSEATNDVFLVTSAVILSLSSMIVIPLEGILEVLASISISSSAVATAFYWVKKYPKILE